MRLASLFIIALSISLQCFAQEIDEDYETLLLEEEEENVGLAFKPIIGVGLGVFSFSGDVNDYLFNPLKGLPSTRIAINRNINRYFDIEFHGTFGQVSGNQYQGNINEINNFKTSMFIGGVSVYYNFNHWLKRKRPIHPYISVGAEFVQFSPKGDILNSNGSPYYYWTDGTIRDLEQTPGGTGNLITRDYVYETDLRSLDLYGHGDYSKSSAAIPIDMGLNVTISDRVNCRFGAAFHMTMTDFIDNVTGGSGWKNDIILNSYVSLSIDLFSPADEIAAVETFKNLKFTITDQLDSDSDGVDDFNDECPDTPTGVKVTFRGCAEDLDKDGVPDYMDKQTDTPSGVIAVGENGVSILDKQLIALLYDPDAVKRSEVKLYLKESKTGVQQNNGLPERFKSVDKNGDRYISHDELQQAIDDFFEGSSSLTPKDLEDLQDYFFNQ